MKDRILSSVITLGVGISFLFVGINNLWPDFIISQGERIAIGIYLTIVGFTSLLWKILKVQNEKVPLYSGVIIGILLLIIGLFVMNNTSFGAAIIAPGLILFLWNFIILLKKKFPNQEFFGRKL